MLRSLFTYFAKQKNPGFILQDDVSSFMLAGFITGKIIARLRGARLLLYGKPATLYLGSAVRIKGVSHLSYGTGVQVGDHVTINAYGNDGCSIGHFAWIGAYSILKVSFSLNDPGAFIRIGNHVGIGEFAHLGGAGGLQIGDDCIIGPYFSCHPENHNFHENETLIREQGVSRKGISIGNNCWIGAKVSILDGVSIGSDCVIAAGAVVTRDMPSNAVIGGVPARVIRMRNDNDKFNTTMQTVA